MEVKAAETATTQSAVESPVAEQSFDNVANADDPGFEGSGFELIAESEVGDTVTMDAGYATLAVEAESLHEVVEARSGQIRHQQKLVE